MRRLWLGGKVRFSKASIFLMMVSLWTPVAAQSGLAVIRVGCEGADSNAEVFINNQFKGECPVDIQIPEGSYTLRVVKAVDAKRERRFEQTFRVAGGTVKRFTAVLSSPVLNPKEAAAVAAEEDRKKRERMVAASQEAAEIQELTAAAQKDDAAAAYALARRLEKGGVSFKADLKASQEWDQKAWKSGHVGSQLALLLPQSWRTQKGKKQKVWPDLQMLLDAILAHYDKVGDLKNLEVPDGETLDDYLGKTAFFGARSDWNTEKAKTRGYMGNLLQTRLELWDTGLFGMSHDLISERRDVSRLRYWGDLDKNLLDQPDPWAIRFEFKTFTPALPEDYRLQQQSLRIYCARLPEVRFVRPLAESDLQRTFAAVSPEDLEKTGVMKLENWDPRPLQCLDIVAHPTQLWVLYRVRFFTKDLRFQVLTSDWMANVIHFRKR
jgi:hypothetical protein